MYKFRYTKELKKRVAHFQLSSDGIAGRTLIYFDDLR